MDDLIEKLQEGCIYRPKRWSGDTHDDLGGPIDEAATESLLAEAAAALEAAREDGARLDWLADQMRITDLHFILDSVPLDPSDLRAAIDAAREARND